MDNLTHSCAGLLLAEIAIRCRKERGDFLSRSWMLAAAVSSVVANNFPDVDLLWSGGLASKLGYLSHHRGHTHTIVGIVPQALIITVLGLFLARRRQWNWTAADRWWLLWLNLVGGLVHIAFDFGNNYGIHPFWPFDNKWYYGDSVFIVEPWLWLSLAAPIVFLAKHRVINVCAALPVVLGPALVWGTGLVPHPLAIALTVWTVGYLMVLSRASPRARVLIGGLHSVAIFSVFVALSHRARTLTSEHFAASHSTLRVHDVIVTPMPANPICWQVIIIGHREDRYEVELGMLAQFPAVVSTSGCDQLHPVEFSAPVERSRLSDSEHLVWFAKFSGQLAELRALTAADCRAREFMSFSRAPFWIVAPGSGVIGDLRYDRDKELGFAEIALGPAEVPCTRRLPPWVPPRQALLELH